ncbi:AAA family ATPase [Nocardia veterana]|uniref:AAA family ATPase n=1 Tax=Nocardia veterana TaxID=132249 RepID=A0A7X6M2C2_9NOCA|nr:AAA family ATPase [Nocardia veterana]NKY89049.1 AAA family ATPase [Nocardia veterana]
MTNKTDSESTPPARWIPGALFAVETDTPPDTAIRDAVTAEVWAKFRRLGTKYELDVSGETTFSDLDAIPAEVFHAAGLDFTRDQVDRFCSEEYARPLPDPEAVGEAMHAERTARFREQHQAENVVRRAGVDPRTRYSLAEAERVCGAEIAAGARLEIDGHNAEVWDTPRPHRLTERVPLATPADLVNLGATPEDLAAMISATREDVRAAKRDLTIAHRRYTMLTERRARTGDRAALVVLSVAELAQLEPPTPLVSGLLYRSTSAQLAGHPGTGKTFAALGMSCAIATGTRWAGHDVPEAVPVVYVAAEGTPYARAAAWCETNGLPGSAVTAHTSGVERPDEATGTG